ncbi:MAG: hypothetical protein ACE5JS_20340 [Nitrospinota bacterium]
MAEKPDIQAEVDKNYEAFRQLLPELLKEHKGKFALLRHQKLVQTFDSARDAVVFAEAQFSDGLYSVQEISEDVADLGFFSHAMHLGPV